MWWWGCFPQRLEYSFCAAFADSPVQETFAARAVFNYLKRFASMQGFPEVEAVLNKHGTVAVRALLFAACDSAPPRLLETLADALYALAKHAAVMQAGVGAALADTALPARPGAWDKPHLAHVASLLAASPRLDKAVFTQLVRDFHGISHGAEAAAAVEKYKLPQTSAA